MLEAGKHLYLAKPMAVDVAGCLAIERAVKAAGPSRHVLVDFQTRRDPLFREAAARVHRGDIGPAVLGHVYYHAGRLKPQAPEGTQTARLRNWVFDKALSGDIIVEQNIHVIDVANWYLQAHPVSAQGTGGRKARVDVGDCWDHYVVTFSYPNGVLVDFSSAQFTKGFDDLRIRVYGATGTVDSAYDGDVRLTGDAPWEGGSTKGLYTSGAVGNIQDFHAAVTGGQALADTLGPSLQSNLTAILGRQAATADRTVTWDEMMKGAERIEPKLHFRRTARPRQRGPGTRTPTLRRDDRQFDEAGLLRRVIHALHGLAIVGRLGPEDVRDERLRVAVVQRETSSIGPAPSPMARQKDVVRRGQREAVQQRRVRTRWPLA